MMTRTATLALLLALAAPSVNAAGEFSVVLRNSGLARTISNSAGILKTTKLEANRAQMLDHPSVEFLIEIEHQGGLTILAPSDFRFREASAGKRNQEQRRRVELTCTREGFPLTVYIDYYIEPRASYQQKAIVVRPSAQPEGAVIKRIVIEDMSFRGEFVPLAPPEGGQGGSGLGAVDPKAGRGVFFFVGSQIGREWYTPRGGLTMWEETDVPLSKGHETGRATIGAAAGPPEVVYERYREFAWNACFALRGGDDGPNSAGDFSKRFQEFKSRFGRYFAARTLAFTPLDGRGFDCEAYTVGGRGFLVLFNPTRQRKTVRLPLDDPGLGLSGEVKLYDWTGLDSAASMGAANPDNGTQIELAPMSARIIGIDVGE